MNIDFKALGRNGEIINVNAFRMLVLSKILTSLNNVYTQMRHDESCSTQTLDYYKFSRDYVSGFAYSGNSKKTKALFDAQIQSILTGLHIANMRIQEYGNELYLMSDAEEAFHFFKELVMLSIESLDTLQSEAFIVDSIDKYQTLHVRATYVVTYDNKRWLIALDSSLEHDDTFYKTEVDGVSINEHDLESSDSLMAVTQVFKSVLVLQLSKEVNKARHEQYTKTAPQQAKNDSAIIATILGGNDTDYIALMVSVYSELEATTSCGVANSSQLFNAFSKLLRVNDDKIDLIVNKLISSRSQQKTEY